MEEEKELRTEGDRVARRIVLIQPCSSSCRFDCSARPTEAPGIRSGPAADDCSGRGRLRRGSPHNSAAGRTLADPYMWRSVARCGVHGRGTDGAPSVLTPSSSRVRVSSPRSTCLPECPSLQPGAPKAFRAFLHSQPALQPPTLFARSGIFASVYSTAPEVTMRLR